MKTRKIAVDFPGRWASHFGVYRNIANSTFACEVGGNNCLEKNAIIAMPNDDHCLSETAGENFNLSVLFTHTHGNPRGEFTTLSCKAMSSTSSRPAVP